jgi:hypothetical protein
MAQGYLQLNVNKWENTGGAAGNNPAVTTRETGMEQVVIPYWKLCNSQRIGNFRDKSI